MSHGGARNRSGPPKDPDSGRSEAQGYSLDFLPPAGFTGPVPEFPLPNVSERELVVWAEAWRTPQACAWSLPSERWRWRTVAMWVRQSVVCEKAGVAAANLSQLHRLADQVGMTTAGLREMGWRIGSAPQRAPQPADAEGGPSTDEVGAARQRRLRA